MKMLKKQRRMKKMSKTRKFRKLGFTDAEKVVFEKKGDDVVGQIERIQTVITSYGELSILLLDVDGVQKSMAISSGLSFHPWDELVGKYVHIIYQGEEKNPKTGRLFKAFDVYVEDAGDDEDISF